MTDGIQSKNRPQSGFTLVELMVVVLIIGVVTVIALPNFLRAMRTYRLNGAATDVANIIQRTRYEAVRLNRTIPCVVNLGANPQEVFIDLDGDNVRDPGEAVVMLPANIQFGVAGAPDGTSLGLGATQAPPGGVIPYNARGTVEFGVNPPVVFMVTLGDPNRLDIGFKAVSVTPVGKTRVWSAQSGGSWH